MDFEDLPTLQQFAIQGLLADEDLVISALEYLPTIFFPPLFEEAFLRGKRKIVKAMVTSWPFPCLPLGDLIEYFEVNNFPAVLDGMDWLSNQNVRPRRCRLQVLSLKDGYPDFWEGSAGTQYSVDSPQTKSEKDATTGGTKQSLKVVAERLLPKSCFIKLHNGRFVKWSRKRRDRLDSPMYEIGYFGENVGAHSGHRTWIP